MENGYADDVIDLKKKQDAHIELVNLHLGTVVEYRPFPAVMDTV